MVSSPVGLVVEVLVLAGPLVVDVEVVELVELPEALVPCDVEAAVLEVSDPSLVVAADVESSVSVAPPGSSSPQPEIVKATAAAIGR